MTARLRLAIYLFVSIALAWVRPAHAESVLFASSEGRTAELLPELTLAVRSQGLLLLARGLGDARTPLERAAAAQRIGRNVGTWAALWVEREPPVRVRAVAISGERIYEAPLPAALESIEPRVFASIASSVLLEALGRTSEGAATSTEGTLGAVGRDPSAGPANAPPWTPDGSSPLRTADRSPRFFLRAGVGYGLVYIGEGARPDRSPAAVLDQVAMYARGADNQLDLDRARSYLRSLGYDCRVADKESRLEVDSCAIAVNPGGVVGSFAVDLAMGARISPRLLLALTARVAPDAGEGVLAHALLGLQLEAALLAPQPTGFWLHALVGAGLGRIQVQPATPSGGKNTPYATSGPANLRVGLQLGYRFTEHVGCYAGPTLHLGFPDRLFAIDPTLGLEARL